ncbi:Maf family protein [Sphingorhabdus sp.]|jgi:septum formation protein|uniref:Maf family protein n=1 Tax=Sphingorhabdus sp. TaxID=1902408 RepID=UPI003BB0C84F|nr:Maf family protein [Sphingomonadales bacterium]MBK9432155.1 Maf family protein [Sphingomonadales bacterium]MBL0023322.1 Maf family protein [Sphingomonadales bacterium]
MTPLILASTSAARKSMLTGAGVGFNAVAPDLDEADLKQRLVTGGMGARDLAEALAEAKALAISETQPTALVIGADQTLAVEDGLLLDKPETPDDAKAQLRQLSGKGHRLFSAAVVAAAGVAVWNHVGIVRLSMRPLSDAFIDDYVAAHWHDIRHSVGCYQIEGAGAQLFTKVEGDYFDVMGLPLLPLLAFLRERKLMAS